MGLFSLQAVWGFSYTAIMHAVLFAVQQDSNRSRLEEREMTDDRESTDELLLGEPVNVLQANTTYYPMTTPDLDLANEQSAARSASDMRVQTMEKEPSRKAETAPSSSGGCDCGCADRSAGWTSSPRPTPVAATLGAGDISDVGDGQAGVPTTDTASSELEPTKPTIDTTSSDSTPKKTTTDTTSSDPPCSRMAKQVEWGDHKTTQWGKRKDVPYVQYDSDDKPKGCEEQQVAEDLLAPVTEGENVHCCTVDPSDEMDGWVRAPYLDEEEDWREVPGAFVYLPVTILRPSGRKVSTAEDETVYVRPGGGRQTREWAEEDMRIIWEVPRSVIMDKRLDNWEAVLGQYDCTIQHIAALMHLTRARLRVCPLKDMQQAVEEDHVEEKRSSSGGSSWSFRPLRVMEVDTPRRTSAQDTHTRQRVVAAQEATHQQPPDDWSDKALNVLLDFTQIFGAVSLVEAAQGMWTIARQVPRAYVGVAFLWSFSTISILHAVSAALEVFETEFEKNWAVLGLNWTLMNEDVLDHASGDVTDDVAVALAAVSIVVVGGSFVNLIVPSPDENFPCSKD
eukprot:g14193.t1